VLGVRSILVSQGAKDRSRKLRQLEPVAAVGNPPAHHPDGDGCEQSPHQGQRNIGDQAERDENGPKDFALHFYIVARRRTLAKFPEG